MAEFKDMLKYYREINHYSQSELARKIGVSPATIGNYEQGTRKPDFETEEALADVFNVSLDNLRGFDSERSSSLPKGTPEELSLILDFHRLSEVQQKLILSLIKEFINIQNGI